MVHGDWDVAGGVQRLGRHGVVMWYVVGIAVGSARRLGHGGWCMAFETSRGCDVAHRWRRGRRCTAFGTWWVVYPDWDVAGL